MSNKHLDRPERPLQSAEEINLNVRAASEEMSEVNDAEINASEQERLQLLRDGHNSAVHALQMQQFDTDERLVYKSTFLYKAAKHVESVYGLRL